MNLFRRAKHRSWRAGSIIMLNIFQTEDWRKITDFQIRSSWVQRLFNLLLTRGVTIRASLAP
jgi:hypothetical protein